MTTKETDLIILVVRRIIRRVAEYNYNVEGKFPVLDMACLPSLD
jgi:hypothetical protein